MKNIILIISLIILSGCATTQLPTTAKFEKKPDAPKINEVKKAFRYVLKDSITAEYEIGKTQKGYIVNGWVEKPNSQNIHDGISWHGWFTPILINARNSFGGYTGFKKYSLFYIDGRWQVKYFLGKPIQAAIPVE